MAHFESPDYRAKRRKIDVYGIVPTRLESGVQIASSRDLQALLAFQQTATPDTKQNLSKFRDFLMSIQQAPVDDKDVEEKLKILKAYCDSQVKRTTTSDGSETTCFSSLIQTWSFAESANNESLLVAVPSTLAAFIKTISTRIDFREFGLELCKYLLQTEQLRLFSRNLGYNKSKEHLISPCIRLLTEIVSFDGGAVARAVHLRREVTFSRLEVFLSPNKNRQAGDHDEANLRFQSALAKGDFIEQHKVVRAFLEFIKQDPRDMVVETLRAIDKHIAQDDSLPRSSKSKFFNRWNLERLVTLYGYDRDPDSSESDILSVRQELQALLMHVCTNPEMGILLPAGGWYPTGSDPDVLLIEGDQSIELGLDSPTYVDKYTHQVPVRNRTLSSFIQELRPESDTLQIELLLAIFKAAPELVADYFSKRTMFISDPKPTPTWLGESAFLFSTVQLPVPKNCGWKDKIPVMPPPISVAIESILPRPLTQKILSRCLNMNAEVVTLFAVRLLSIALRKLQAALKNFAGGHGPGQQYWNQAVSKLVAEFCRRCPSIKDVIILFRRTPKDDLKQRDAVTELLSLFYEIIPSVAFEESLDVTLTIVEVLNDFEEPELADEKSQLLLSQLQNLLGIAKNSATLRWWQQPASLQYSAFSSILNTLVVTREKDQVLEIRNLLRDVMMESSILSNNNGSFDGLLGSLESSLPKDLPHHLEYLDNCICRVAKQPVHYTDLLAVLPKSKEGSLSPLLAAIDEQWTYLIKIQDSKKEKAVGSWIAQLLRCFSEVGEDCDGLMAVRDRISERSTNKSVKSQLKKIMKDLSRTKDHHKGEESRIESQAQHSKTESTPDLLEIFGDLPLESKGHSAIYKWENEDLEIAIEQGRVRGLLLCLCSEHEDIRRQASAAISRLMAKLKESNYLEWRSIYVLLGEVWETTNQNGYQNPLPCIAGELAASCLTVLTDPLHKMYGKVNLFLQKHPSWEIEKIPSYWIDKILLHEPEYDDGYGEEMNWLLDLLIHGLRTLPDLEIYRRTNVFERLLALYCSSASNIAAKKKILHVIFRATQVGGGATLTTRAGIISWLQGQIASCGPHHALLSQLAGAIYSSGDRERMDKWSGDGLTQLVAKLTA